MRPDGVRTTATQPALLAEVAGLVGSTQEARWIVEHVEARADGGAESAGDAALALARRRAAGEPLQYVLGTWAFREIELSVDPRVLIPRPETEAVVEVALGELGRIATARRRDRGDVGPLVCVDLGTGSGAIALSLAVEAPAMGMPVEVWACDESPDALEVARSNLAALATVDDTAAQRVTVAEGSWYGALPGRLARCVDLVVSNPPYVSEDEYRALDPGVRDWEPRMALVAGRSGGGVPGMADVEVVVAGADAWLRRTGALVVELAPSQAYGAIDAARRGGFSRVETARDLAGRLRMLVAER